MFTDSQSTLPGVSRLLTQATPEFPRHSEGDLILLKDERLLHVWGRKSGAEDTDAGVILAANSTDAGLTWDDEPRLLFAPWDDLTDIMSVSLCRASNGIHLFFLGRGTDRLADCRVYQSISHNEGSTWSTPQRLPAKAGYNVVNNARVILTATGRLLIPIAHIAGSAARYFDTMRVYCLYSDDLGHSWQRSSDIGLPDAPLMEPGVVECADGSIYMTIRTALGYVYESRSQDVGATWCEPIRTTLVSPSAPATLLRDPHSADLWIFYCANPAGAEADWAERNPLAVAISQDHGATWGESRLIEDDPGKSFSYISADVVGDFLHLTYYDWSKGVPNFYLTNIRHRIIPLTWIR